MIHRLNEQAMGTAAAEGRGRNPSKPEESAVGDSELRKAIGDNVRAVNSSQHHLLLKSIIDENDAHAADVSSDDKSEEGRNGKYQRKSTTKKFKRKQVDESSHDKVELLPS